MNRIDKMFHAIVVMGAAITASACGDSRCAKCVPPPDAVATTDATTDAGPGPTDAPVDMVLIL